MNLVAQEWTSTMSTTSGCILMDLGCLPEQHLELPPLLDNIVGCLSSALDAVGIFVP